MSNLVSIVIACHGEATDLRVMMGCLDEQREYRSGPVIKDGKVLPDREVQWTSGPKCNLPTEIIICCDGPYNGPPYDALRPDIKIIECPKEGSVGHGTREVGIKEATGGWIVLTNSDNYFVSGWQWSLESAFQQNAGLIYWNCVNNLWKWGTRDGCELEWGKIDLSCVAVRADIAKQIGFPWRNYDADWNYINACSEKALEIVHINQVLSVHN